MIFPFKKNGIPHEDQGVSQLDFCQVAASPNKKLLSASELGVS